MSKSYIQMLQPLILEELEECGVQTCCTSPRR